MSNFDRLNNYLTSYDAENERISSSLNSQRLEKLISENSIAFEREQEQSGSLLTGGQLLMSGQETVDKLKKGYKTAKKLKDNVKKTIKEGQEFKEDLPNRIQKYKKQGDDFLKDMKSKAEEVKNNIHETVKSIQQEKRNYRSFNEKRPYERYEDDEDFSYLSEPRQQLIKELKERIGEEEIGPKVKNPVDKNIQDSTKNINEELKTSVEKQEEEQAVKSGAESEVSTASKIAKKVGDITTGEEEVESAMPELSEVLLPAVGVGLAITGLADLFGNKSDKVGDIKRPVLKPPPNFGKMLESQTTFASTPQSQIQQTSASF